MNMGVESTILLFVIIWLIIISCFVLKIYLSIRSVSRQTKDKNVIALINNLLKDKDAENKLIESLTHRISSLEEESLSHIYKIGLVRFNPFGDTGGEQSFILALLDHKKNGLVLSGLYSRSGMRWYIKKVINGKGLMHELSVEEQKAIDQAK